MLLRGLRQRNRAMSEVDVFTTSEKRLRDLVVIFSRLRDPIFEAVKARQAAAICEDGVDHQRNLELLDAGIDAVNNLIASECSGCEDRKSTRLNSSHSGESRMPSSA